jgi:hypothetical protein
LKEKEQQTMKHRKFTAAITATAVMIALSGVNAFAAGAFDSESTAQRDRDIEGNAPITLNGSGANVKSDKIDGSDVSPAGRAVPVYGYVGEDTVLVDPAPKNPDVKPNIGYDINVSVPVKILWAAFESAGASGNYPVESPEYSIINNSGRTGLTVRIDGFAADPANGDNMDIDGDLVLQFKSNGASTFTGDPITVFDRDDLASPAALPGILDAGAAWGFKIGGTYDASSIPAAKQPNYFLMLKFATVA